MSTTLSKSRTALSLFAVAMIAIGAATDALARSKRASNGTPPVAELLNQYRQVAFGSELGRGSRNVIKWTRPIIVDLVGPRAPVYRRAVLAHFRTLSRLTGVPIRLARSRYLVARETPNMMIYFESRGGQGPRNLERACETWITRDRWGRIRTARIRINADWRRLAQHCIVEEISQAMGLMNDSAYLSPSIFNDNSRQQGLSRADRMLLRAHYDGRIRPGMSWWEARPIIRANLMRQQRVLTSGTAAFR